MVRKNVIIVLPKIIELKYTKYRSNAQVLRKFYDYINIVLCVKTCKRILKLL